MKSYYFNIANHLILCFETDYDLKNNPQTLLRLGAYLPNFQFLDAKPNHIDFKFRLEKSRDNTLIYNDKDCVMGVADSAIFTEDVYHLLYGIVRKHLHARGLYCVHAACVGVKDSYRLLVGHSGSGKTTLAQQLIDTQDMTLFSGNKTVLKQGPEGRFQAIAGTKTMTALRGDFSRYAYRLKEDQYSRLATVPIQAIDLIRLNDGVEECQTLSTLSALHTLYPYLLDQVNADVIIFGDRLFDGALTPHQKGDAVRQIGQVLKRTKVRKLAGSLNYLTKKVLL